MRNLLLLLTASLPAVRVVSQPAQPVVYGREITVTTENDAYLLQRKDAYYTNGFFFTHKTAREKNGQKRIAVFELGQMIFTPLIRKTTGPADIDRPYCGLLYLKLSQQRFLRNDDVLQSSLALGEVGRASLGEDVQNGYHRLLKYGRFTGWQYQVQDALGIDAGISFAHTLLEDSTLVKLVPVAEANLGLNFTNAKLGAYVCLGSFEKNRNSALWNARVQTKATATQRKYELFVYWYPQLIVQGYNSTIQGGLLRKGSGAVLGKPETIMFQQSLGVCYAEARWTTKLALVSQSREAVTQTTPQQYGSIQLSYRLH
ncbi:MAG: lipid A deacylase LpxR family protein [Bacteroidota bacterium]